MAWGESTARRRLDATRPQLPRERIFWGPDRAAARTPASMRCTVTPAWAGSAWLCAQGAARDQHKPNNAPPRPAIAVLHAPGPVLRPNTDAGRFCRQIPGQAIDGTRPAG